MTVARRLGWLTVWIALVPLTACQGPSGPVEVPADELPFSLARSPAPSVSPSGGSTIVLYFVRGAGLAPVSREVAAGVSPVDAAVQALLEGPTPEERLEGMTSEIPPETSLLDAVVLDLVAQVDLSSEFQGPAPPDVIVLRVAQVVWTLVNLPQVTAVRFEIEGEPVSVVTAGGTVVDRPVTAPDYGSVAPKESP